MRKNITKDQIVKTALAMMRTSDDLRALNLRKIARTIGCAHTNLYNYFPSYNDLLWETHAALQELFSTMLTQKMNAATSAKAKLETFFTAFVELYLENKGWFRLAWQEYIGDTRPQRDIDATKQTNEQLTAWLCEIWKEQNGADAEVKTVKRALHVIHCYIVGEVSNHLLGRGLIKEETELQKEIVDEAVGMFHSYRLGA